MPFIFLNHVPTWYVSKFYPWQIEQPHQSRIEHWIPCLAIMVYVVYCLFSSYGIPTRIREFLRSLGGSVGGYLDIAKYTLQVLVGVPRSCPRPLLEYPLCNE